MKVMSRDLALFILLTLAAHAQAALDTSLLVDRFSQCSYNALSSVLVSFYGPLGTTPDRAAFEKETFLNPLNSTTYGGYYGWGPWTSFIVNSGKLVWNGRPVTDLKAERFSLRTRADVTVSQTEFVVKYGPGERELLRDKLLKQLAKGPAILWTPYAAAFGLGWKHVRQVDEFTDTMPRTSATHSVALFLKPDERVLVVDGSDRHGVYLVDPDVIVATSAAMTGFVRIEDEQGQSIYKNKLNGVSNDEYNVTCIAQTGPTTALIGPSKSDLQAQATALVDGQIAETLPTAFSRARQTADAWASAIVRAPSHTRNDVAFLVSTMPAIDLQTLDPKFIVDDVTLAHATRDVFPWAGHVPDEVFRSAVLPYVNLSETRESWRAGLATRCGPLVRDCKTASEAALVLNEKLYPAIGVTYHPTKRPRPDQSPSESIAAGYASCSGLSILLVDACRSVGIPARVVGTPLWFTGKGDANGNHAGNHTWVEIWDHQWHVLGASEPSPLDQTWFLDNAAKQSKAPIDERYRIYACSPLGNTYFPMGWAPTSRDAAAIDVTADYAKRRRINIHVNASRLSLRVNQRLVADSDVSGGNVSLILSEGQTYQLNIMHGSTASEQTLTVRPDTATDVTTLIAP